MLDFFGVLGQSMAALECHAPTKMPEEQYYAVDMVDGKRSHMQLFY